ncbi:hypothetical protein [Bacteroides clarus]|uniref:hypothetical protein n=1 Tax=Bacteroides clarus TaxID=626929 RepID=UPI0024B20459|nr:hypothetical protein [Bacteroides clarus]
MKKISFDLSHPYLLHRSKKTPYWFFFAAFMCFIVGLTSREIGMFGVVLSIIFCFVGINKLKRKDKIMRIDNEGVTTEENGTIHWKQIKRCYYKSFPTTQWEPKSFLEIVLKNNEHTCILLNEYSYDGKALSAAINFYSGRKLFGRIEQDDKDELKGLLKGFAFVLVFISFVMLLLYLSDLHN